MYKPLSNSQIESAQLFSLLDTYLKKRTATKNKIHGKEVLGTPSKTVIRSLKRNKKHLDKEIKAIETKLLEIVKSQHQQMLTHLMSIPGIGLKTALFLMVATNGFLKFEKASHLCSYAGIIPTIKTSGTSVRGRSRISKMGNQNLRNLLFLCAFNACKYNEPCRKLFERLVAKGKSKKLALIAVANKLLKQCFAVAVSNRPFDPTYISTLG